METVQDFVAIADAPSGQANFDVRRVGPVVVIPVGHEQQVGRRADVDAVEPDGQG